MGTAERRSRGPSSRVAIGCEELRQTPSVEMLDYFFKNRWIVAWGFGLWHVKALMMDCATSQYGGFLMRLTSLGDLLKSGSVWGRVRDAQWSTSSVWVLCFFFLMGIYYGDFRPASFVSHNNRLFTMRFMNLYEWIIGVKSIFSSWGRISTWFDNAQRAGFQQFFKNQGLVLDTSNLFHLIAMIMDYSV